MAEREIDRRPQGFGANLTTVSEGINFDQYRGIVGTICTQFGHSLSIREAERLWDVAITPKELTDRLEAIRLVTK